MATELDRLVEDERVNALLSWVLVGFVLLVAVGNAAIGELSWALFAAAVVVLALQPPVRFRSPLAMLPWEVLALAAFPLFARTFTIVAQVGTGALATYLAVAAVALIVAVNLHVFTPVEMNAPFAVVFVVVATMAAAGVWAVARFAADTLLGTNFLLKPGVDEHVVERNVMLEFVYSTVAGVGAGIVFDRYFRRRRARHERLPPDVEAELQADQESFEEYVAERPAEAPLAEARREDRREEDR
ncbi:MAG: hypothetical protein ABEJ05_13075 [Haloglomus sp.]